MSLFNFLPSGGSGSDFLTFSLTISPNEPTPEQVGHIWVKTENTYSRVKVAKALIESEEDDTLILLVGNKGSSISGSQQLALVDSSTADAKVVVDEFTYGYSSWAIHYNGDGDFVTEIKLSAPHVVYGKKNGTTDLEDAFIWDGEKWTGICIKGYNLATFGSTSLGTSLYSKIYSFAGTNVVESFTMSTATGSGFMMGHLIVPDHTGEYLYFQEGSGMDSNGVFVEGCNLNSTRGGVYKRKGLAWEVYAKESDLSVTYAGVTYRVYCYDSPTYCKAVCMAADGQSFVAIMGDGTDYYRCCLAKFTNNGTTFVVDSIIDKSVGTSSRTRIYATKNLEFILDYPSSGYIGRAWFKQDDGTYTTSYIEYNSGETGLYAFVKVIFSPDENYLMAYYNGLKIYKIDYANSKLTLMTSVSELTFAVSSRNSTQIITVPTTDGKFCVLGYNSGQRMAVYDPDTNSVSTYTVTGISYDRLNDWLSFSIDGKYLYRSYASDNYLYLVVYTYEIDHGTSTIAFTQLMSQQLYDIPSYTSYQMVALPGISS